MDQFVRWSSNEMDELMREGIEKDWMGWLVGNGRMGEWMNG